MTFGLGNRTGGALSVMLIAAVLVAFASVRLAMNRAWVSCGVGADRGDSCANASAVFIFWICLRHRRWGDGYCADRCFLNQIETPLQSLWISYRRVLRLRLYPGFLLAILLAGWFLGVPEPCACYSAAIGQSSTVMAVSTTVEFLNSVSKHD